MGVVADFKTVRSSGVRHSGDMAEQIVLILRGLAPGIDQIQHIQVCFDGDEVPRPEKDLVQVEFPAVRYQHESSAHRTRSTRLLQSRWVTSPPCRPHSTRNYFP